MRHSKWFVLAFVLAVVPWMPGCNCDPIKTNEALGDGKLLEEGPNKVFTEVEETTLDWNAVLIDSRVEKKIKVRNFGNGTLEITSVERSEGFPAVFNYDIPPFKLDVSTDQDLSFFFEPKVAGTYEATITLLLGSASNDRLIIHLKARGVEGACSITPADVADFGSVALGTSYVKHDIIIANASELEWEVNVKEILSDSDPGTFVFNNFVPGILRVPARSEIRVPVEFKPNHVGEHLAALSIPAPEICQPNLLQLKGQGVDQVLECEPKVLIKDAQTGRERWECLLDFGFVNPGAKASAPARLKNLGNQEITVSNLVFEQDTAKGNAFGQEVAEGAEAIVDFTIMPGESKEIPMHFMPTLLGQHTGKLNFKSTDQKRQAGYFVLVGIGGGPAIDVQPGSVGFGPVALNTYQKRRITVSNVGTDISGTTDDNLKMMEPDTSTSCSKNTDCPEPSICQRSMCWVRKQATIEVVQGEAEDFVVDWPPVGYPDPAGLAAGASAEIAVRFAPKTVGDKKAYVHIFSNDPQVPDRKVLVEGTAVDMPPCDYEIVPSQLNFGIVEAGKNLQLGFSIRNRASNADHECLISTLGFARGTPTSFTLVNGPVTGATIKGGEVFEVPIRFAPKQNGTFTGSVEFYISSPEAPEGRVSLTGTAQPGCLMIAPSELDFGVIQVNCNSRDRLFTIYNVCSVNQTIQSIELQQGLSQEFHIIASPVTAGSSYPLPAGNSADFKVRYSPVNVGTDQGSIAIKTQLAQPYVIPLSGRGDTTAIQTDVFAQDPKPKVDVLFVVDSSGSMYDEQEALASNFDSFIRFAVEQQVDYHVMVTDTGVGESALGCNDNYGDPDLNGCPYRPTDPCPGCTTPPPYVTPETTNADRCFSCNARVGTDGNATESLIRPAYLALTNPNLTGCTQGFLRDEANLAVVVVSDAADQDCAGSGGNQQSVAFYLNALLNIKGFKRQNMFTFNSITPNANDPSDCSSGQDDSALSNTRVEQVVTATAGVSDSICTTDWSQSLERLGQTAFGYRTRFFLSNVPDLSEPIEIQIDGDVYDQYGEFGDLRWWYTPDPVNAIDFSAMAVPEPGSTITVSYHVDCLR
ncbi:MAG: choice-of-anchor D domain-containing protein [Deltaproteobacteria bacterium]|nr:choice-of-anchor D domain-containing protein [Deltaproteobacteria bacterium]